MKNLTLYTLLSALYPLFIVAQAPDTLWTRVYSGWAISSVRQTDDGGYMLVGSGLAKTDAEGNILWTASVTCGNGYEGQQTRDRGYIVVGTGEEYDPWGDIYRWIFLEKKDSLGSHQWTRNWGYNFEYVEGHSVQQTIDHGYIVAGWDWYSGGGCLIKTDSIGGTIWRYCYIDPMVKFKSVQQTTDSGYITAGEFCPNSNGVLMKADSMGNALWTKIYENFVPMSVKQTFDAGYILIGYKGTNPYRDVHLMKTDSEGDTLWTKTYGGPEWDQGYSGQQTADGGYVIAGRTSSFGAGSYDFYVIKTDSIGDTLWTKTYGGPDWDWAWSIQQTLDFGYIIGGNTWSFGVGGYLIKTEPDIGIEEDKIAVIDINKILTPVCSGPLSLPEGKHIRVFDITGRVVTPQHIKPGVYFIEVDGEIVSKVIKIK